MCLLCRASVLFILLYVYTFNTNCFDGCTLWNINQLMFIIVTLLHVCIPLLKSAVLWMWKFTVATCFYGLYTIWGEISWIKLKYKWKMAKVFMFPIYLSKAVGITWIVATYQMICVVKIQIRTVNIQSRLSQFICVIAKESGLLRTINILCTGYFPCISKVIILLFIALHPSISASATPLEDPLMRCQAKYEGFVNITNHHNLHPIAATSPVVLALYGAIAGTITVARACSFISHGILSLVVAAQKIRKHTGGTDDTKQQTTSRGTVKRKLLTSPNKSSKRKSLDTSQHDDEDEKGSSDPRGRKRTLHNGESCGDCAIWLALGGNPDLKADHNTKNQKNVRHPKEKVDDFNKFLSVEGQQFKLNSDSCICNACYLDFLKKHIKSSSETKPRWVDIHKEGVFTPDLHCAVCHFERIQYHSPGKVSPCKRVKRWWSSDDWLRGHSIVFWEQYFKHSRPGFNMKLKKTSKMCHKHYMEVYHVSQNVCCKICNCKSSDTWTMLFDKVKLPQFMNRDLKATDWICTKCVKEKTHQVKTGEVDEDHKFVLVCVKESIELIKQKGYIMRKELSGIFKEKLDVRRSGDKVQMKAAFEKILSKEISSSSQIEKYCVNKYVQSMGSILYDSQQISSNAIVQIYESLWKYDELKKEKESTKKDRFATSDIKDMLHKQVTMFTDADTNFDYNDVLDLALEEGKEGLLFGEYIHKPLFDFFCKITGSEEHISENKKCNQSDANDTKSKEKKQTDNRRLLKDSLKIQMSIAVLCNMMNKDSILMQKLIGFNLFAGGTKNKQIDNLNAMGLSCSAQTINTQAKYWSDNRNPTEELDPGSFWRVSFDNLNFKRKYAKTFADGGDTAGRMLNLITSQVSHRKNDSSIESAGEKTKSKTNVTEDDFFLQKDSVESKAWKEFLKGLFNTTVNRMKKLVKESTFLDDLQDQLPTCTPDVGDNVVYTRIEACQASSVEDVSSFLKKLKEDLRIGQPGYPNDVIVVGDQQTYAIMKNLIMKYPDAFKWIRPMPGCWHLIKLASECLRDMLWDGGLQDLAKLCGHHKELTQWRDVHRMLLGLHQSFHTELVNQWQKKDTDQTFDEFVDSLKEPTNEDEVSRFWASTLQYLDAYVGYYWAIRTGNWNLRNACMPKLSELFFAFSHNKYEELVCQSMKDQFMLPPDVIDAFLRGEWTVSASGVPYHNQGIDEAHESIINKRTKEITTRPSEYRVVTLANFIAILDNICFKFNRYLSLYRNETTGKKLIENKYSLAIDQKVKTTKVFTYDTPRQLHNIFCDNPKELDNEQRKDLLNVENEGKRRMMKYIRQYVLTPPTEVREKRIRRKMKTFSKLKSNIRTQQSKVSRLTKLTKSLSSRLQQSGQFYDRILEYPLAIADEFGNMRPRQKSTFKEVLMQNELLKEMFCTTMPLNTTMSTEIIFDGLKFIHEKPPPNISTYSEYAVYLYNKIVTKLGFDRGADCVTICFDKPQFLSKIRDTVHTERKKGKRTSFICPPKIADDGKIPQGLQFSEALTNQNFKTMLLDYVTVTFTVIGDKQLHENQTLILDSPTYGELPMLVTQGASHLMNSRKNKKGEADSGVWWHAKCSQCYNILIHAGDTDIYMFGIALASQGHYPGKEVVVERRPDVEYVHINVALRCIQQLDMCQVQHHKDMAAMYILALYLLSGSDYVSCFYKVSNSSIMQAFFKYIDYVSPPDDPLVKVEGATFRGISASAFTRLICCTYLDRHSNLYAGFYPNAVELYNALQLPGRKSPAMINLLGWLQYEGDVSINTLSAWADLTRRICYFNSKGKTELFKMLPPSDTALKLHVLRGEYVMKLAMESCDPEALTFQDINGGWQVIGESVSVRWEEDMTQIKKTLAYKKAPLMNRCTCKDCSGKSGCLHCAKAHKPCTPKCNCKGVICFNPHKDGGSCPDCPKDSDHSDISDTTSGDMDIDENPDDLVNDADEDNNDTEDVEGSGHYAADFSEYFGGDDMDNGYLELVPFSSLLDEDV